MDDENVTLEQQLKDERDYINTLNDTTEAAYRMACLKSKIAAMKGDAGASEALAKSEKALNDHLDKQQPVEWFANSSIAGVWLADQGYSKKRGGGSLSAEAARKFVDTLRKDSKRGYSKMLVKRAADKEYGNPLKPAKDIIDTQSGDNATLAEQMQAAILRKNLADAQKKEMEVIELKREQDERWLYRDDAMQQMAAIWALVQQALDYNIHLAAEAIALVAGGLQERAYEVEAAIQELIIAKAFNEVSSADKIHVIFKREEEV